MPPSQAFPRFIHKVTRPVWLLTAIIILAAILRTPEMNTSLWGDEMLTHMIASQDLTAALTHSVYPLSYVLAHFALKLGDSEILLRLHSYLAGILAIWAMYHMGRAWHSRSAGLTAAFLLALSSSHIYYSQEARFYSLLTLAAILTLWSLKRLLDSPHSYRYSALYILATAIGSLSHLFYLPYFACVVATTALAISLHPAYKQKRIRHLLTFAITTLLGILPWMIIYLRSSLSKNYSSLIASPQALDQPAYLLTLHDYATFWHELLYLQLPGHAGIMMILIIGGVVIFLRKYKFASLPVIAPPLLLPLPLFFVSVSHFYASRYFITLLPAALLLGAVFITGASRYAASAIVRFSAPARPTRLTRFRLIHVTILLLTLSILTPTYLTRKLYNNHHRDKWKEHAAIMAPYVTPNDVIIHFAPYHLNPGTKNQVMFWYDLPLAFYLNRLLINKRHDLQPKKTLATIHPAQVDQWLTRYRDSNIWLIHWRSSPVIRLSPAQERLFHTKSSGWSEIFQLAAAPTTNLLSGTDFENQSPIAYNTTGSVHTVAHTTSGPGANPGTYLRIGPATRQAPAVATFPLQPDSATTTAPAAASAPILTPGKNYVLSLDLKYTKTAGAPHTTGSATIILTGQSSTGQLIRVLVDSFYYSARWNFYSFPIRADDPDHAPLYHANSLNLELAYTSTRGAFSVDNIQFEAGNHPTPYTNAPRHPHDQALALIQTELTPQ